MSGTDTPSTAPPSAPDSGPASGVTTPVAGGESSAPAAFSPEPAATPEPAAVVETVAAEVPAVEATVEAAPAETSILSEATDKKPEAEETPAEVEAKPDEPKAEEKVEDKPAEEPKAEEKPKEPLAKPVYEAFKVPETVKLAEESVAQFTDLLGETQNRIIENPADAHVAFQELGQKMVDLYTKEVAQAAQDMAQLQRDMWTRTREDWVSKFRQDPELGKNRQETTLQQLGSLMDFYGTQVGAEKLDETRKAFALTGAGDHPEVLRFMNFMARRLVETSRPVVPIVPRAPVMKSPAQRLYRNSLGNGAA